VAIAMTTYTAQYPPSHNDTYVKATTKYSTSYWPYFATDPAKSLTGGSSSNAWVADVPSGGGGPLQRFHIDLGSAKIIRRLYYENYHSSGINTNVGEKAFTLQGSNTAGAFAELTYAIDTYWNNLTIAVSQFDEHSAADAADPKYILVTNAVAYRYYALKLATNWGHATDYGIRRIVLQTEDGFGGGFVPRVMIF
jgi:hypothetical protein